MAKKDWTQSPRNTNGPVVRTGPTSGQNRSRKNNGAWRRKRNDTGKSRGGCFITTAACQHKGLADDCHELQVLRMFRDQHLLATLEGSALVERYYEIAPAIAARLTDPEELEAVWQEICACVSEIESGHFSEAITRYAKMVESLP